VVRDGRILYRDNHHLTATFVRSLADPLEAVLAPFLWPVPTDRTLDGRRNRADRQPPSLGDADGEGIELGGCWATSMS